MHERKSASDLNLEFVPFSSDRSENRAQLRKYLNGKEVQFIAVHFGMTWSQILQKYVPEKCFVSSAEVYDFVTLNAFVKENPELPAIGFIRVRIQGDVNDGNRKG